MTVDELRNRIIALKGAILESYLDGWGCGREGCPLAPLPVYRLHKNCQCSEGYLFAAVREIERHVQRLSKKEDVPQSAPVLPVSAQCALDILDILERRIPGMKERIEELGKVHNAYTKTLEEFSIIRDVFADYGQQIPNGRVSISVCGGVIYSLQKRNAELRRDLEKAEKNLADFVAGYTLVKQQEKEVDQDEQS